MGDRGQVYVKDTKVYLYTHWGAEALLDRVAAALALKERWDDEEYLTRIIFQTMLGDDRDTTGFGIGSEEHGDIWRLIIVDCGKQKIIARDNGADKGEWTFKEFAEGKWKEAYSEEEEE